MRKITDKIQQLKKTKAYKVLITLLGCFIISLGINGFFVQQHTLSGGVSGISMIIYYLTGIPIGFTSVIINIPLFIIAYKHLGKHFISHSFIGMLALAFFIDLTSPLNQNIYLKDPLLSCILGGIITGTGSSLMYKVGSSTGGGDIIAYLMNKFYGISIGAAGMMINFLVITTALYPFGLEPALYTCIAFFASFKTISTITTGFDFKKDFIIISENPEKIAKAITHKIGRGVTYLHGTGAFTGHDRKVIFVVVKLRQVSEIRNLIKDIDPTAFTIIHDTADVMGKGFTLEPDIIVEGKTNEEK